MKTILTCVSDVAILQDEFEVVNDSIPEQYKTYELNEWDAYALETAVSYAEEEGDVEVVTVTIGPERAEETIRTALAKGADRAIRVWDDTFAEHDVLFPTTKSSILAAVARSETPGFICTGVQTGDEAFGATGVSLARQLDYQWAAVVTDVEIEDEVVHVHRELEGGVDELVDVELPAVLTIQSGINEPRYASLRGIRQAQSKELRLDSLADLGLDSTVFDDRIELVSTMKPDVEGEATIWEGEPEQTAGELTAFLKQSEVV